MIFRLNCVFKNFFLQYFLSNYNLSWAMFLGCISKKYVYRIFRDYGNIPGLDIAYMKNGYVYHTKYDDEQSIPAGSIQRAGNNKSCRERGKKSTASFVIHSKTIFKILAIFLTLFCKLILLKNFMSYFLYGSSRPPSR